MQYEMITGDGGPAIRMTVDQAWLKDPKRRFPVRIDPQYNMPTPGGDTYSLLSEAGTTHGANDSVAAGRYDDSAANKARGFLRFGEIPMLFSSSGGSNFKLDSARLHLFQTYQIKDGTAAGTTPTPASSTPATRRRTARSRTRARRTATSTRPTTP